MATIPTQNPVPSEAAIDLKFNAGKIDEFVTSFILKYTDRLGREHLTIEGIRDIVEKAIKEFGWVTIDSFEIGATLTNSSEVLRWESNGEYYRWDGSFPKVVPSGSTPTASGGIGTGKWLSIGDAALRGNLISDHGDSFINMSGEKFTGQPLSKYLAWRNGDITAFGGKYSDNTAGALNKAAFSEMESVFGGVNLNLMGESVYLPDDMNLHVSSLDIWGGGTIYPGLGLGFVLNPGGFINAKNFHAEGSAPSSAKSTRMCGVELGSAYKIKDISFSQFTTHGRVILFSGLGKLNVNPETTDFGCNSISMTNFHCEEPFEFILEISDWPFQTMDIANFTVHNMAGTLVNAGTTNEGLFERQLQKSMNTVSVHDYSIINDDTFWADGIYSYTCVGVFECWSLNHYNGYQSGVKIRVNGNSVYDIYNGARLVTESDITVIDCYAWNDWHVFPHKIKSSFQYTSQNKRWYYRRAYVSAIKAIFPTANETNSTGTFFFPETDDWHNEPIGPLEYGNRFIHIDNCDIELIRLGHVHGNPVNNNIRLTNNHFSSLSTLNTNFIQLSCYPFNFYQQITVSNNRFNIPSATVSAIIGISNGNLSGGGGFSGVVDFSKNIGRFSNVQVFSDFTTLSTGYANMMLSISDNKISSSGNLFLTGSGTPTNLFDLSMCSNNYLSGNVITFGALWNTQGRIEIGCIANGPSPITIFETGIPTAMNVATGDRYINIDNGSSGTRVIKFTITKDATTTSIAFTDASGAAVIKKTSVDNGTFSMNVGVSALFSVNCIISSSGVSIKTASSLRQRFNISGYNV